MKIAVVDDDVKMFEQLRAYFEEYLGNSAEFSYFQSGEAFLCSWRAGDFDLVILDIFMGGITGTETACAIRQTDPDVKIVFGTTSNEFASESYEVNACYYLLKPFGTEQIKAMVSRLNLAEIEKNRTVKLPDGTNAVLRNIIYADCSSHIITLHCKNQKNIVLRANFSEIEQLLCAFSYFISPSKGVIVNFYEVAKQNRDTFIMSDETPVPISRRKSREVLEAYSSFLFEKLRKGDDR